MRKLLHVQYNIEYHIVWTTKYRYKVLEGKIALRTRELIRQSWIYVKFLDVVVHHYLSTMVLT